MYNERRKKGKLMFDKFTEKNMNLKSVGEQEKYS